MIKVTLGSNFKRATVIIDPNTTIGKALSDNAVEYGASIMHLNGTPLAPSDFEKTFADFGITESCYLVGVVKADNA